MFPRGKESFRQNQTQPSPAAGAVSCVCHVPGCPFPGTGRAQRGCRGTALSSAWGHCSRVSKATGLCSLNPNTTSSSLGLFPYCSMQLTNFPEISGTFTQVLQAAKCRIRAEVAHVTNRLGWRCWGLEPTLLLDPLGHPPQLRAAAQHPTLPQAESPAKGIINFQLR